jgi:hypothetical protein
MFRAENRELSDPDKLPVGNPELLGRTDATSNSGGALNKTNGTKTPPIQIIVLIHSFLYDTNTSC